MYTSFIFLIFLNCQPLPLEDAADEVIAAPCGSFRLDSGSYTFVVFGSKKDLKIKESGDIGIEPACSHCPLDVVEEEMGLIKELL